MAPPRILTTDGAARLGMTPGQVRTELRRDRWRRLAKGVLLTRPDEPTRYDWLAAGLAVAGPGSAASGWDVVRKFGLGSATPPVPWVLVLTSRGKFRDFGNIRFRPSARPLDVGRFSVLDADLPNEVHAALARAIADTALTCTQAAEVRAMVTTAVQRQLVTVAALVRELEHCPRNGSRWFRLALADVTAGARSVAEAEAIALLRADRRIPPFETNTPILDTSGNLVAVADLLWRRKRGVLEIDSREYHFSEVDWKRTMQRHNRLLRLGYSVAHYPPSEIRSRERGWVDEVNTWLRTLPG